MKTKALEICNLTKTFKDFKLDNVSFTLPAGFIMGLVGENGAGKTTTIKLIFDLLEKENGVVKVFGNDTKNGHNYKQDIAVVFDDLFFVEDWKISDIEKAVSPFYSKWDTKSFHTYLNKFNISMNKKIKELSKGMKMKLNLAVALSHQARLLILDEPTSGLDPVARDELLDILLEYIENENNSILFSTHITSDLDKIADYLTVMNDGKIFYTGVKDELFDKYCIVKGGIEDLTPNIETKLIGIQKGKTGFTALLNVVNMKYISDSIIVEKATLDEILIHINK
ncbi:ABC transporter ATP-binding protein [Enterococcus cecorum]|nr:ABC transporter ATP-binding protein [Enterococcus cecorum]